jgi:hypothetical protein
VGKARMACSANHQSRVLMHQKAAHNKQR